MSVHEYSFKFTKLTKSVPSFVTDPRDEMSRFVMGVSNKLKYEFHSAMLNDKKKFLSYGSCQVYIRGKV